MCESVVVVDIKVDHRLCPRVFSLHDLHLTFSNSLKEIWSCWAVKGVGGFSYDPHGVLYGLYDNAEYLSLKNEQLWNEVHLRIGLWSVNHNGAASVLVQLCNLISDQSGLSRYGCICEDTVLEWKLNVNLVFRFVLFKLSLQEKVLKLHNRHILYKQVHSLLMEETNVCSFHIPAATHFCEDMFWFCRF